MGIGFHSETKVHNIKGLQRLGICPISPIAPEMGRQFLVGPPAHVGTHLLLGHCVGGSLEGLHLPGGLCPQRDERSQKSQDRHVSVHPRKLGKGAHLVETGLVLFWMMAWGGWAQVPEEADAPLPERERVEEAIAEPVTPPPEAPLKL